MAPESGDPDDPERRMAAAARRDELIARLCAPPSAQLSLDLPLPKVRIVPVIPVLPSAWQRVVLEAEWPPKAAPRPEKRVLRLVRDD